MSALGLSYRSSAQPSWYTSTPAFFQHHPPAVCETLPYGLSSSNELKWMTEMYRCVDRDDVDAALEILYDELVGLQTDGRFAECDDMLAILDIEGLDSNLMVGVLSVTYQARDRLRNRARVLQKIERRLGQLAPNRVEALIGKLR